MVSADLRPLQLRFSIGGRLLVSRRTVYTVKHGLPAGLLKRILLRR
jgi:hypothetical protein